MLGSRGMSDISRVFGSLASRRSGMTLLEILLATVIMALAMIPVSGLMGYGARATTRDHQEIECIQLLEKNGNLLLKRDYRQIPVGNNQLLETVSGRWGRSFRVFLNCQEIATTTFSYNSIQVNLAGFDENNPRVADFNSTPETISLPNCVKQLNIRVDVFDSGNVLIKSIQAVTFSADMNRRG